MTVEHDPRIVDAALSDLRAWSATLPEYDVEAGAARHVALLDASATPTPGGVAAGANRGWWIAGATAVLALGLVTAMRDDAQLRAAAPALSSLRGSFAGELVPIAPESAVGAIATASAVPAVVSKAEPDASLAAPRRSARPRAAAQRSTSIETPAVAVDSDAVERELAVVRRMRRLLDAAPEQVWSVATQAERDFGRGLFGEERAALRVFALARLGDARMQAEAAAFLREFGEGPFATKVARVRDDEGSAADAQ